MTENFHNGELNEHKADPGEVIRSQYINLLSQENTDYNSADFREVQSEVILNILQNSPEYPVYLQALSTKNVPQIRNFISLLREALTTDPLFSNRHKMVISNHDDLKKYLGGSEREKIFEVDPSKIDYSESYFQIPSLYHWIPTAVLSLAQKNGLLPEFLSDNRRGNRQFVYCSIEQNEFWPNHIQRGEADFTEIEIRLDPDTKTYMWLNYFDGILVSSDFAPLSNQVSALVKRDIANGRLDAQTNSAYQEGYFSNLLQLWVPYNTSFSIDSWESSEVLLDYVPPENITPLRSLHLENR